MVASETGQSICLWPRTAVELSASAPPRVASLIELAALVRPQDQEDATLKARLSTWDERCTGWLPGFTAQHRQSLAEVTALHSRRPGWTLPHGMRPTLPSSTLRRANLLLQAQPKRVWLMGDVDCLGVLLAHHCDVVVSHTDAFHHAWIRHEAERAGLTERLTIVTEPAQVQGDFDVTVFQSGPPAEAHAELALALAHTRVGGTLACRLRLPWEEWLIDTLTGLGLRPTHYEREIDQWLVPGPFVVDGGQDMWLCERSANLVLPSLAADAADAIRQAPYGVLDLDNLAAEKLNDTPLERFAALLAAAAPLAEQTRSLQHTSGHQVLCWYDTAGHGLTAELRREEAHLLISLLPFSAELEYVALWAALHALGDEMTRVRPLRTRRMSAQHLFG